MPTSSPTNKLTNVTPETEADLAAYGIVRKTAMENAAPQEDEQVFFGMKQNGNSTELTFGTSIQNIQDKNMTVAMVAPENKTFNMLLETNFNEAISSANEDDLRSFLRGILRKV